ncbi:YesL family protein [Rossellomorea sp. BNER]|uniref:YesL family protein n=1 Tax=Rossellomorea sp. BNER TaxID=2962031 RepID=UPI003AF26317|nr:DUF624 domain-containing protein [Rossellomorea sp. BNER]
MMGGSSFSEKVYEGTGWLVKLVYVQLLFLLFTSLGFVLFGLFPASAALFAIVRQWLLGKHDVSLFRTFWNYFKEYFVQANVLGWFLSIASVAITFYFFMFREFENGWGTILVYLWFPITILLLLLWLFWLPVLVHYEIKGLRVLKLAVYTAVMRPLHTVGFVVLMIALYYWSLILPGFIPILNISLLVFGWMWIARHSFQKFDEKVA